MQTLEERIYAWFIKKSKSNKNSQVLTNGVTKKLYEAFAGDPVTIRKALKYLQSEGKLEFTADQRGEPISSFIRVTRPLENVAIHAEQWNLALANSELSSAEVIALAPLGSIFDGVSITQMSDVIDSLIKLRDDQEKVAGQLSFNISASYFLGSSKLLSSMDSRALRSFGIKLEQFPSRPPYIIVGGNTLSPNAILLIENPVAFEKAVQSEASNKNAFICTFGFGLSNANNEFGNQLAGIIENGTGIVLNHRGSNLDSLREIFQHPEIHFWGDLDIAGLQIYERIANQIPQLQLSAMYIPMLEALSDPKRRHSYVMAVGKSGQKPFRSSREETKLLLEYCKNFAVDQELVTLGDIERFCGETLKLDAIHLE